MSKKEEWSEISFSSSEITYYDLIVEEKDLNSIEKISDQISNVIAGGESDSTAHLVLGNLNHFKDEALGSSYLSIESTDINSFDYTIENQGKLVSTGCSTILVGQSLMNVAVASGVMPTTGLPLPMISYGGSSLVSSLLIAGLLLRCSLESTELISNSKISESQSLITRYS